MKLLRKKDPRRQQVWLFFTYKEGDRCWEEVEEKEKKGGGAYGSQGGEIWGLRPDQRRNKKAGDFKNSGGGE